MGGVGIGVRGMSERMRQLGGRLELVSNPGGTTLIAMVPVEKWEQRNDQRSASVSNPTLPADEKRTGE